MEKKRKLPARAAAREHVSKKRTVTPPDHRSVTPGPAPPVVEEPPPQSLPKSIQPGKPLPTVDEPQADDLPARDYQSVQESGVLADSLHRSRQKWVSEGIFEKYWSKPSKRKGVVIEEPNNPAKDTMMKLGQVTITVEPHVFEATMFAVKDPKPPPAQPPSTFRPIIQYGPPNGIMPAPPTPTPAPTPSSPAPAALQTPSQTPSLVQSRPQDPQQPDAPQDPKPAPSPAVPAALPQSESQQSAASPLVTESGPSQSRTNPPSAPTLVTAQGPVPPQPTQPTPAPTPATFANSPSPSATPLLSQSKASALIGRAQEPARPNGVGPSPPPGARPAGAHPPGTDPIIVTLAEKATEDPQLRDLMKRVANGNAPKDELEKFQRIIDQITAESRRKGGVQGPSADRLLVDGRTVRYFAEEVRTILDIVLNSNPNQKSYDLRPPARSDPLVVMLVKKALDDPSVKDTVRRIAENRPQFNDGVELKAVLDKLKTQLRDQARQRTQSPAVAIATLPSPKPNTPSNGQPAPATTGSAQPQQITQQPPQQALRSKGPPPPSMPEISAVVFEFAGGTGDRYLFPKFSILESVPMQQGQQVIASFLIVRRGSKSEYGGDPEMDYYQPVTIRLYASSHRHLDSLMRVIAPADEVRRYMSDVMSNMTRAEYVLLAMRLPRRDKEEKESNTEKEPNGELQIRQVQPMQGVLWTSKASSNPPLRKPAKKTPGEDEQYQNFISTVTPKQTDEA